MTYKMLAMCCMQGRRGKKKPFINKQKAESYSLAPRSQRDPRFYDEDASKYVLVSKRRNRVGGFSAFTAFRVDMSV